MVESFFGVVKFDLLYLEKFKYEQRLIIIEKCCFMQINVLYLIRVYLKLIHSTGFLIWAV